MNVASYPLFRAGRDIQSMDWLGVIRRTAGHSRHGSLSRGGEAPKLWHGCGNVPVLWRTLSQP